MNLLKEEIPCAIYFQSRKKEDPQIEYVAKFNPYIGMVQHKFVSLPASHIVFKFNQQTYQYNLCTLGGKYFVQNYEDSPFYRLFNLTKSLPPRNETSKKLKI